MITPAKIDKVMRELNPDRIYVENMRHLLGVNHTIAKWVCEIAVRKGYLRKCIGLICENENCNRIIEAYDDPANIPEYITCDLCKEDLATEYRFQSKILKKIEFYKYVRGSYNPVLK